KFDWSISNYGYHVQGAYYEDNVSLTTKKEVEEHLILLVENDAPFECKLKLMDDTSLSLGKRDYLKYLHILAKCYEAESFPRKPLEVQMCGLPETKLKDALIEL